MSSSRKSIDGEFERLRNQVEKNKKFKMGREGIGKKKGSNIK
jgi:hypothetical protein